MISRYAIKEIESIWNDQNKLNIWLDVEKFVVEAWKELKVIPQKDCDLILKHASINQARMLEIEQETKHDVVAFTRAVSETLGEEKRWIHLGLTSTDIVDTAQNKMLQQSNEVVLTALNNLSKVLLDKAVTYKNQIIMGRTHGMYGEPTSLGLKFLLWFEEINRQMTRFNLARTQSEVVKISGSMGNYANLELEVEEFVAQKMNLAVDLISTQVTQRDRHANLIGVFANIATTLEKMAVEIRLFQRSEVQEMSEGFEKGQKGSSSMPHKKNPISSENISGLARYVRAFVIPALENNVLWHERDISHSSNERLMLPDIYSILVYIINRMTSTISNLVVNEANINKHINEHQGLFFSQRVLTYILMNYNHSREKVYDFIQKCTLEAQLNHEEFKAVLIKNNVTEFISDLNELESLFDIKFFIRHVESIYRRVMK